MSPRAAAPGPVYAQVYEIVRRIPEGKVLTYGLVSAVLGGRLSAQGIGWALRALPEPNLHERPVAGAKTGSPERSFRLYHAASVPWHRVVNSSGGISTDKNPDLYPGEQRHLLEREGVLFDDDGKLDLDRYLWRDGLS